PRLLPRLAGDPHSGRLQPGVLGGQFAYLHPQRYRQSSARLPRLPGDLQQPVPAEEHHPRVLRVAELAVHRQPERVAVEGAAEGWILRSQDDPAAEHVHRGYTRRWPSSASTARPTSSSVVEMWNDSRSWPARIAAATPA